MTSSPKPEFRLSPWLQRLCREGITGVDHDDDERERTAGVIGATLKSHPELITSVLAGPLAKHPEMIADMLDALRPYVGEVPVADRAAAQPAPDAFSCSAPTIDGPPSKTGG